MVIKRPPSPAKDMKTCLTSKEIARMIELAPDLRAKALLSFLSDTGCRVSEALALKPEHLDFAQNMVLIPHLKTGIRKKCPGCGLPAGKTQPFCSHCGADLSDVKVTGAFERGRLINVGTDTMALLKRHIGQQDSELVFPITRQGAYKIVRRLAEQIGVKQLLNPNTKKMHHVHTHTFRDSLAVDWLRSSKGDITMQKALQEHLGHTSFNTTMRYHKLSPSEIKEISEQIRKERFGSEDA